MSYSSVRASVGFSCLCDDQWTIAGGKDALLGFLGCPSDVFAETYQSSLVELIAQAMQPLQEQVFRIKAYGVPCLCSVARQNERWLVQLDRLPFGLEGNPQGIGLFRLSEGARLRWANDEFYQMLGVAREGFASEYSDDLSCFDPILAPLSGSGILYDSSHNLIFCATASAGYCFSPSASSVLHSYQKALKTNGMRVWQYDLTRGIIEGVSFNDTDVLQLERLHQRLRGGEKACSARLFLMDEQRYVSVQYTKEGSVAFAVEQDITSHVSRQRFLFFEESQHGRNHESLDSILKIDLTDNKGFYLKRRGLKNPDLDEGLPFIQMFEELLQTVAFDEERQTFRGRFNHASLLEAQQRGLDELSMEYRSNDETGSIYWLEVRVLLNRDLETNHIHALGISRRITEKKKLELSLAEKPLRDPITNFYDKKTFSTMVSQALKTEDDRSLSYALALVEVQACTLISDALFSHLAQSIRFVITDRCIVGRLDSTHFGLFFARVEHSMDVRVRLERLAYLFGNALVFDAIEHHIFSSIGVVSGLYGEERTYEVLSEKAVLALDSSRARGKNQVSMHTHGSDLVFLEPLDRDQTKVLGCMDATVRFDDLGSSLPLILSQVGMYYHSKRVCLMSQEKGNVLQVVASWEPQASSRAFLPIPLDPFADLFTRQQVKKLSLSPELHTPSCLDGSTALVANLKVWNLEKSYLVVLDPFLEDASVLSHAAQLLSGEMTKRRLLDRQEYLLYHDSATGLRNFHGYNQYVSTLQEDAISSLGLIVVDINDLKEINKHHGKEYGNTIIRTVAKVLREIFPKASLFRLSSHEFLGIRVDVTYKAFKAKVERLTEQLQLLLPRMTTLAQAWSEQEKQIPVLYNQASMELEANRKNSLDLSDPGEHYQAYEALATSIRRGEYLVYLQPKISCTTGLMCGSEALIRHLHPTHGLVSPSKFIPQFEQDGLIKYIDLFVFEEVCKLQSRWKEEGRALLPISLNFSRLTLLDDNLISTMQEILSRNGVDSKLVEIEITESFGSLDRNLVQKVVEKITDAGFEVCIDDFGSEYSNLSTLTSLPLKVLKLDKSLINSLAYSAKAQAFVEGFITICKKLDIRTVAEGVETQTQKEILSRMGCDMIQGYFFDKPLAIEPFEQKYVNSV